MKPTVSLLALLLLGSALGSASAQAMSFDDFRRMNDDDDATYVTNLVEGAAKMLRANGQPDQARQVIALFKDSGKQGGVNQLAMNSKEMYLLNTRNATNPNSRAHIFEVEDAMARTLKQNGFIVPVSYLLTLNLDFHPSGPPRQQTPNPSSDLHP